MKVLQLCHRVPFPANDGGNIAMISIADALLAQGASVKMLALNTQKHFVNLNSLDEKIKSKYAIDAVPIDTSIRAWDAFVNLFSNESYNVSRFYDQNFESRLVNILQEEAYDVVLMESLFMTLYIPAIRKTTDAKIILRAHNVEHIIWERLAKNERSSIKRYYLELLAKRLKNYEVNTLNIVDAIVPITKEDEHSFRSLGCIKPMLVAPVGIDGNDYPNQIDPGKELCLFHLGAMDWRPNLEGVEWFLEDCWKGIHDKFPALKLYLAGRGFPKHLIDRNDPNVVCEGEILNAQEFMHDKQIMIVPLKSGGGMRVKIIQGLALGKTIITTTIGAEGISYTDGLNILIANSPEEILAQVSKCLLDPASCLAIGQEARKLALENYSNAEIGKKLLHFFNTHTR